MAIAEFFTALGVDEMVTGGFTMLELVLAAVLTLLFAASLALSIMAARSASAARQARGEAREALAEVREQAAQFRALSGDLERTAGELAATQAELKEMQAAPAAPVHAEQKPEAASAPVEASLDAEGQRPIERRFDPLPPGETAEEAPEEGRRSPFLRGLLRRR